jgi:hypothetical protein
MDYMSVSAPSESVSGADSTSGSDVSDTTVPAIPTSTSKKKRPTRRSTKLFGLGSAICNDDATITGSRLPTCSQVLRCMMYHCNLEARSVRPGSLGAPSRFTTAKEVLKQVAVLYQKANIPMVTERRACEKIVKLLDDNNKLRSIDKTRRDTPATQLKLKAMQSMLSSTFQLWPPNVEGLLKDPEDLAFIESMKGNRAASFGAFDKALAQKISRRDQRAAAALERLHRANVGGTLIASSDPVETDESSSDESQEAVSDSEENIETTATPGDMNV